MLPYGIIVLPHGKDTVCPTVWNLTIDIMTNKEKKFLDKKLKDFMKRLEKPEIKKVFVRLKDKWYATHKMDLPTHGQLPCASRGMVHGILLLFQEQGYHRKDRFFTHRGRLG